MAYILDGTTIKSPRALREAPLNIETEHQTISGDTKKDITARKMRYILFYENILKTDADTIFSIYDQKAVVTFQVTDTNKTISSRNVHVDVSGREYATLGTSYLVTFNLILTEEEEI
jgi:hypothetical protein